MNNVLLSEHLGTHFYTEEGTVKAVDDVSFRVKSVETVCIVGESGCGKSITAMLIMGLIQSPDGKVAGGSIRFEDTDLLGLSRNEMRTIRGHEISMIFQEPMSSLNPVMTIGEQLSEPLVEHLKVGRKEAH